MRRISETNPIIGIGMHNQRKIVEYKILKLDWLYNK